MLNNSLKEIDKAPESGHMLIYTRDGMIFKPYENRNDLVKEIEGKGILEIHLFDKVKEYRAVFSTSKSRTEESVYIEHIAKFDINETDDDIPAVFSETAFLEDEMGQSITVLNHISFDKDTGMAYVDDYRLWMED